jgi:DNA-binding SARP family transcriptional activator
MESYDVTSGVNGERTRLALGVFEGYPYGILVAGRDGAVHAHNPAAQRLLGEQAPRLDDVRPHVACDLLCCRCATTPLEDLCLFERAAGSEEPLPEIRIDLPAGSGVPAVWVTAAPLAADPNLVVVELRPGQASDRRRRTTPHWKTQRPELRIYTLGRTRVESAEGPIAGRWLENRPGQVLKYLVAERHRTVYADEIAERVWRNAHARRLQGIRYFVHALRDTLEPNRPRRGASSFIVSRRGGYALDTGAVWVDADAFERDVTEGLALLRRDRRAGEEELERGLARYGGDFLADEPYADWAFAERDRLRGLAGDALRTLVELRLASDDLDAAAAHLERLAELDPFDIDAHRHLIAVAVRRGRRGDALRRYTALRHRMLSTFGEDLDFTLSDLSAAA